MDGEDYVLLDTSHLQSVNSSERERLILHAQTNVTVDFNIAMTSRQNTQSYSTISRTKANTQAAYKLAERTLGAEIYSSENSFA